MIINKELLSKQQKLNNKVNYKSHCFYNIYGNNEIFFISYVILEKMQNNERVIL